MSFEDLDDYTEAHEKRIKRCSAPSCRARIIFLPTSGGRSMPVDADTVDAEDEVYEQGKHVSHFTTCTESDRFRSRGQEKPKI